MNTATKPGWFSRILLTLATLGLVVVGFFFLTAALIAGVILALVIGVRLWWTLRKLKRAGAQASGGALEGEYQVVERDTAGTRLPPNNTPPAP